MSFEQPDNTLRRLSPEDSQKMWQVFDSPTKAKELLTQLDLPAISGSKFEIELEDGKIELVAVEDDGTLVLADR